MENKQKLGIKVFYYYLSKNILSGVFLLIASVIIVSFKKEIIVKLSSVLPTNIASSITGIFTNGLFIISLLVLLIGTFISWLKYKSYFFVIGENTFTIKRGIFNKKEVSIPYLQIQNIHIEQSFSERLMGICRLHILTAGNDNGNTAINEAGVNFDIIDIKVANNLKEVVLQKTNIKK